MGLRINVIFSSHIMIIVMTWLRLLFAGFPSRQCEVPRPIVVEKSIQARHIGATDFLVSPFGGHHLWGQVQVISIAGGFYRSPDLPILIPTAGGRFRFKITLPTDLEDPPVNQVVWAIFIRILRAQQILTAMSQTLNPGAPSVCAWTE